MKLTFLICYFTTMIAGNRLGVFTSYYLGMTGPRKFTNNTRIPKSTLSAYEVRQFIGAGVLPYSKQFTYWILEI